MLRVGKKSRDLASHLLIVDIQDQAGRGLQRIQCFINATSLAYARQPDDWQNRVLRLL